MKAVVISAPGKVEVVRVDDPTPGPRDVIVRVAACGLCGTDLHILRGEVAPSLPVIPGHEFAGRVVAVGTEVTERRVGDVVAVDPSLPCRECHYCRRGRENLCERFGAIGVTTAGAAAEYAVAPVANCVPLPEHVRVEDATLIEPLACAVRGYDVLRAEVAANVLIYGAGTMGLIMLELAKRTGAASVDMVDINPYRLDLARKVGCTSAVDRAEELDRPRGWEVVIDATGNAAAIQDGLGRVGNGGTYLQFGVADYQTRATISPYRIYRDEITIVGSMAVLHSFERAAALFAAGVLDPDVFITDRVPLEDYPRALDQFAAGIGCKIQVVP